MPENTPMPAPRSARGLWLALTGGAEGCPRKRFFISLALCLVLEKIISFPMEFCAAHSFSPLQDVPILLLLPLFLWFLSVTVGVMLGMVAAYTPDDILRLPLDACGLLPPGLPIPEMLQAPAIPGSWLHVVGFCIFFTLIGLTWLISFGLAWRRLKDAGVSRWHLLAGLWPLLLFIAAYCHLLPDFHKLPGCLVLVFFLRNLGGLWLFWLWCKPTVLHGNAGEENA